MRKIVKVLNGDNYLINTKLLNNIDIDFKNCIFDISLLCYGIKDIEIDSATHLLTYQMNLNPIISYDKFVKLFNEKIIVSDLKINKVELPPVFNQPYMMKLYDIKFYFNEQYMTYDEVCELLNIDEFTDDLITYSAIFHINSSFIKIRENLTGINLIVKKLGDE